MPKYFNVFLEFDHERLYTIINKTVLEDGKGYVCVVDGNVLTRAQKDFDYLSILNSSLTNTCDGSSIALLANWIYKENFKALSGPHIFEYYIEKPYKQLLLGSTEEAMGKVRQKMHRKGITTDHLQFLPLPFVPFHEFNYSQIAGEINKLKPDLIWVSLGAPKQERFMHCILPYINSGVLLGVGAAFSFYSGDILIPKISMGRLSLNWFYRVFKEPNKTIKRIISYLVVLPRLYWAERKIKNKL